MTSSRRRAVTRSSSRRRGLSSRPTRPPARSVSASSAGRRAGVARRASVMRSPRRRSRRPSFRSDSALDPHRGRDAGCGRHVREVAPVEGRHEAQREARGRAGIEHHPREHAAAARTRAAWCATSSRKATGTARRSTAASTCSSGRPRRGASRGARAALAGAQGLGEERVDGGRLALAAPRTGAPSSGYAWARARCSAQLGEGQEHVDEAEAGDRPPGEGAEQQACGGRARAAAASSRPRAPSTRERTRA